MAGQVVEVAANSGVDSEIGSARPRYTGRTRTWPVCTDGGDWFAGCRRAVALPSRAGRQDRAGGPRGRLELGEYSYHQAAGPAEQARVLYPELPRRSRAGPGSGGTGERHGQVGTLASGGRQTIA